MIAATLKKMIYRTTSDRAAAESPAD